MSYEVLARKWRPGQFADVVGQAHVTETLKNAIGSNRVAHAYLFTGPRGIGKTSLARIFAKALNCVQGPTATPCDRCDACLEITGGHSLDVMEIDGASNRGIEHIRDLRQNVQYAPARGKFKIYIIDEVHMLSPDAFNALLKTLEEPPAHVKFIFATTEVHKIPATILSRCQRFDLRRIAVPRIVERLASIAETEKVQIDADALLAIARGSEGGLRDAESAMDQLIAFCGNHVTEADVLSVFGLVARHALEDLAQAILTGDIPAMLRQVAVFDESGKDLQRVVVELLDHFRNLLVFLYTPGEAALVEATTEQAAVLPCQAALTDAERILRITDILMQTEDRIRFAVSRRTTLETALVRCARAASAVSIDEILAQLNELRRFGGPVMDRVTAEPVPAAATAARQTDTLPARGGEAELNTIQAQWQDIKEKIGKLDPLIRSYLGFVQPLAIEGDQVVIGYNPEFAKEIKAMESTRAVVAFRNVIGKVLNRGVQIRFHAAASLKSPVAEPAHAGPSQATPTPTPPPGPDEGKRRRNREEMLQDPGVQKVLEMFNGTIADIE